MLSPLFSFYGIEKADGKGKQKPKEGEDGRDLTEKIEGQRAIIPNVPAEPKIENAASDKFKRRDGHSAKRRTQKEIPCEKMAVDEAHGDKANAAEQSHTPVGMAAIGDLDAEIGGAAQEKDQKIFDGDSNFFLK